MAGEIVHSKKTAFLNAFMDLGHISNACKAAEIARQTHYDWMENDPDYVVRFQRARKIAGEMLIDEARRRAHDGWDEPVYHLGQVVGQVRKYDSTLLMFLIKQLDPSYRERYEITGKGGEALLPLAVVDALLRGA